MKKRVLLFWLFVLFLATKPAFARGDKTIPQVADGQGMIRTKLDFLNPSDAEETKLKIQFFKSDGTAWRIETNLGIGSEFPLNLTPLQTSRLETLGRSASLTSGYVIIRDEGEENSTYSVDFQVGTTVSYEIFSGANLVDAVSVAEGQPTTSWMFPVEMDQTRSIYTGLAIVNLSGTANKVGLYLWPDKPTSLTPEAETSFILGPGEQRAEFLNQRLFPTKLLFRGMVEGFAEKPIAVLALLQRQAGSGVQYTTLTPLYRDALRRNTYLYLPQPAVSASGARDMPLDADIPLVDYFTNRGADESRPWDVVYRTESALVRKLLPVGEALLAPLGSKKSEEFDELSLGQLRGLTYKAEGLDLSGDPTAAFQGFAFAVRTNLGRYVKLRIANVIQTKGEGGAIYYDLALEVYVYR